MLGKEELEALAQDIKDHGLKHDIVVYEGKVLDGRNRQEACIMAGVQPTVTHYTGDDPVGEVMSLNHKRRHLSKSDLAIAATKATVILERLKAEARERQKTSTGGATPQLRELIPEAEHARSTDQLGEQIGVSGRLIRDAQRLKDKHPTLYRQVESQEIPITRAMKIARDVEAEQKAIEAETPEPEEVPKKRKRMSYRPDIAMRQWAVAKARLDTIIPEDISREQALKACIEYCENRLKTNK